MAADSGDANGANSFDCCRDRGDATGAKQASMGNPNKKYHFGCCVALGKKLPHQQNETRAIARDQTFW
jgi:hypothetical protein